MELAILRLLHIVFGVVWAGGAICLALFVLPSVTESGPAGGEVMRRIASRKLPQGMLLSGFITVLTGLRLYMMRFSAAWLMTPEGMVLTLGGLLAVGALAIAVFAQWPTARKLQAIGAEIASSEGPPTAEMLRDLEQLKGRMHKLGNVLALHLAGSLLLMSSMRLALVLS